LKNKLKELRLFLKKTDFDRGIKLGFAIAIPFAILYFLGYSEFAPAVAVGVLLNSSGDIPGSKKRKINAILISIALTSTITATILFLKPFLVFLLFAIAIISFLISIISVYGFRASLVSFSGLLAMVISFAVQKDTAQGIFIQVAFSAVGGFLYLMVSLVIQQLAPKREQNQLLADTLSLLGTYLKLRAKLLTKKTNRDTIFKETLAIQIQINEKHETLREILLTARKRSGRSRFEEKQLLILVSTINIFELIEAEHLDYNLIDEIFGDRKNFLEASKNLNKVMGNHMILLSDLLIQNKKIPNKDTLLTALSKANDSIDSYVDTFKLPEAREGALILRNLYDYQEQLLQEIRTIRRVIANVHDASKISLKREDSSQFLTLQEYRWNVLTQNLSLKSKMFRHSLRLTIAIVFTFLLGYTLEIQNAYWIMLTVIVIMRPNYGLTKERSKDRVLGTIIGAIIAFCIVLLTQNEIVYAVLAFISLVLSFSLIQQNYKSAAAFVTISIIFLYSFINPNAFEVIQYRILDTVIGAIIAVVANYIILPTWEADNLRQIVLNALKMNKKYLLAAQVLYENPKAQKMDYNLARKDAFLAVSNLNASFQRLTQDPKSKQREFQLIYEIVTINQTMISAIAAIGNFIINHKTTPASEDFKKLIYTISGNLQSSADILEHIEIEKEVSVEKNEDAQDKLFDTYKKLSHLRDENIKKGNKEIDTETLHQLQEAYLISNHLNWLKSLSESLKKAIGKYSSIILE
jgi:uncharacterized membrane protein YccC